MRKINFHFFKNHANFSIYMTLLLSTQHAELLSVTIKHLVELKLFLWYVTDRGANRSVSWAI